MSAEQPRRTRLELSRLISDVIFHQLRRNDPITNAEGLKPIVEQVVGQPVRLRTIQRRLIAMGVHKSRADRDLSEEILSLFTEEEPSIKWTNQEMAAGFKVSTKTIARQLKKLYASGAIVPSTKVEPTQSGHLVTIRTLTFVPVAKRIGRAAYYHLNRRIPLQYDDGQRKTAGA